MFCCVGHSPEGGSSVQRCAMTDITVHYVASWIVLQQFEPQDKCGWDYKYL